MLRTRTMIVLFAAAGLASLLLAAPASASHGCSAHARGGKIIQKTREANVFVKRKWRYGCAARTGKPYRLPGLDNTDAVEFGDGNVPILIKLNGVYVAYGRYTLYPAGGAGDTQVDLFVVDLRTGKTVAMESVTDPRSVLSDNWLEGYVLKRNGSVAWIGEVTTYGPGASFHQTYEVHRFSTVPGAGGRAELDEGDDVAPESIALSDDRRTVSWMRGGQMRSAPLP